MNLEKLLQLMISIKTDLKFAIGNRLSDPSKLYYILGEIEGIIDILEIIKK